MIKDLSLEEFRESNNIKSETWEKSNISWETLVEIGVDHEDSLQDLIASAEFMAKVIQGIDLVHSVRWRVKDTQYLLEKIVRKKAESNSKYQEISKDNYFHIITDLIGVRALHLFKNDCFKINEKLRPKWKIAENPLAYMRNGDQDDLRKKFKHLEFEIKDHPDGYRSIHYVFELSTFARKQYAEVQVRTIFEEGWSEIDHHIRYPNFLDDELVSHFLNIFNRWAGSADEMGSFVQGLNESQYNLRVQLEEALSNIYKLSNELKNREDGDEKVKKMYLLCKQK